MRHEKMTDLHTNMLPINLFPIPTHIKNPPPKIERVTLGGGGGRFHCSSLTVFRSMPIFLRSRHSTSTIHGNGAQRSDYARRSNLLPSSGSPHTHNACKRTTSATLSLARPRLAPPPPNLHITNAQNTFCGFISIDVKNPV